MSHLKSTNTNKLTASHAFWWAYIPCPHTITILLHCLQISHPPSHYAIRGESRRQQLKVQTSMECKHGNRGTAEKEKNNKVSLIDSHSFETQPMTISRNKKSKRVDKVKPFCDFAKWIGHSENPFILFGPVLRLGMGMLPSEDDEDEDIVPM